MLGFHGPPPVFFLFSFSLSLSLFRLVGGSMVVACLGDWLEFFFFSSRENKSQTMKQAFAWGGYLFVCFFVFFVTVVPVLAEGTAILQPVGLPLHFAGIGWKFRETLSVRHHQPVSG